MALCPRRFNTVYRFARVMSPDFVFSSLLLHTAQIIYSYCSPTRPLIIVDYGSPIPPVDTVSPTIARRANVSPAPTRCIPHYYGISLKFVFRCFQEGKKIAPFAQQIALFRCFVLSNKDCARARREWFTHWYKAQWINNTNYDVSGRLGNVSRPFWCWQCNFFTMNKYKLENKLTAVTTPFWGTDSFIKSGGMDNWCEYASKSFVQYCSDYSLL